MINYYWETREEKTPMRLARRIFIDLVGVIVFISLFGTVVGAVLLSRSLRAEAFARVRNDLMLLVGPGKTEIWNQGMRAERNGAERSRAPERGGAWERRSVPHSRGGSEMGDAGPLYTYLVEKERLTFSKGERGFVAIPLSILESEGFFSPKLTDRSACADGATFWLFATGKVPGARGFAGVLLNGNEELVFGIQSTLFGEGMYGKKPFGTFTIFCGDKRVATTVIGPTGKIALGTRVSEVVREKVLEEGTLKYRPGKVDLMRSVVEVVLKRLMSRLDHGGMELRWDWPESAVLDVDAELMDICFSNLVINAIKYGSGWVELSARKRDGGWVLGVRNGGSPIPADMIPLLFRKYSRLVKSDDGAGLGLNLVRQIVERHGGKVWCESGEERGTGFFIKLGA